MDRDIEIGIGIDIQVDRYLFIYLLIMWIMVVCVNMLSSSQDKTCPQMFTAALFIIAKTWK